MTTASTWDRLLALSVSVAGTLLRTAEGAVALAREINFSDAFTVTFDAGARRYDVDVSAAGVPDLANATPAATPETIAKRNDLAGCSFGYIGLEEGTPPAVGTYTSSADGHLLANVDGSKRCLVDGDIFPSAFAEGPIVAEHGSYNSIAPGGGPVTLPQLGATFINSRPPFVIVNNASGGSVSVSEHGDDSGATIGGAPSPYAVSDADVVMFIPEPLNGRWGVMTVTI